MYWRELGAKKQELNVATTCRRLSKDWQERRARFALNLIRLLPGLKTKTLLDIKGPGRGERIQVISSERGEEKQWAAPLAALRLHLVALLELVTRASQTKFNYAEVVLELGLETEGTGYLDKLLFLARSLAYLKTGGSLLPAGIELFVQDLTPPDRDSHTAAPNRRTSDSQVYQQFEEGRQLKQLRLLALECLTKLTGDPQDQFIKHYFGCEGSAALVGLLGEHLGEDDPKLQAYRQQALLEEEAKLNDQQRLVYEAPLDKHLQVIAGPGSGKTHTLTLRVARLVHKEGVPPEQIVVLAYNRAVVIELKDRLSRLFQRLGYGRLINRLHAYTFHGFCQRVLGEQLAQKPYDEWVPCLAQELAASPTLLQVELRQPIAYTFVDEFQDITTERLNLLQIIAPPDQARLCVIGDPNQSIYGYEKAKAGESMDPHPYYKKLWELYMHETPFYLTDNYRSYPGILEAATSLLANNTSRFKSLPPLRARREPVPTGTYCEIIDARTKEVGHWHDKLRQLLGETYEPGPDAQGRPQAPKRYRQVAVMLRSNDEVFRAYTELDKLGSLGEGVTLRVQGASGSPVASREFRELLQPFYAAPEAPLATDFLQVFARAKEAKLARYGHVWDPYLLHLAHCLLHEFRAEYERRGDTLEEAIHQELLDFITDLARHDDGHFAKLYDKHIKAVAPNEPERYEVVLTTMHKVKGLEFDAVIIPSSLANFGVAWESNAPVENLAEITAEERRLFYVAYTRARYRLVALQGEREQAVLHGKIYYRPDEEGQRLRTVREGLDKLFISWGARKENAYAEAHIMDKVKIGAPVLLRRGKNSLGKDCWYLCLGATKNDALIIGQLSINAFQQIPTTNWVTGLGVCSIQCYTIEESSRYDATQSPPTDFTSTHWHGEKSKPGSYIYVVDFAGYYKEV